MIYQFEDGKIVLIETKNGYLCNIVHKDESVGLKIIDKIKKEGLTFFNQFDRKYDHE